MAGALADYVTVAFQVTIAAFVLTHNPGQRLGDRGLPGKYKFHYRVLTKNQPLELLTQGGYVRSGAFLLFLFLMRCC